MQIYAGYNSISTNLSICGNYILVIVPKLRAAKCLIEILSSHGGPLHYSFVTTQQHYKISPLDAGLNYRRV